MTAILKQELNQNLASPAASQRAWFGVRSRGYGGALVMAASVQPDTAGLRTEIQRAKAFVELGLSTLAGLPPRRDWTESAARSLRTLPVYPNNGALAEGADVPDSPNWDFVNITMVPKNYVFKVGTTKSYQGLATNSNDAMAGDLDYFIGLSERLLKDNISRDLTVDNEEPATARTADYTGSEHVEPYDRIFSSFAEHTDVGGSRARWNNPYTRQTGPATYESIVNRDAANGGFDANVLDAQGGTNFGTNSTLTENAIDKAFAAISERGNVNEPDVIWTGPDTISEIHQMFSARTRFNVDVGDMSTGRKVLTDNVEATMELDNSISLVQGGHGIPLQVSTIENTPLIKSNRGVKGASPEKSRIFFITWSDYENQGPQFYTKTLEPLGLFDSRGLQSIPINNKLEDVAGYYRIFEQQCTRFSTQAKITSIE